MALKTSLRGWPGAAALPLPALLLVLLCGAIASDAPVNTEPFISHVEPHVVAAGARFAVRGDLFGTAPGTVTVGEAACEVVEWTDGTILATAPQTAVVGPVKVSFGGRSLTSGLPVQVSAPGALPAVPRIDSVSGADAEGKVQPGAQVTLKGSGFGAAQGLVRFSPRPSWPGKGLDAAVVSWTDTEVVATVPNDCEGEVVVFAKVRHLSVGAPAAVRCP